MPFKVCASWLVMLVLLPLTAPFSTFDVASFLPGQSVRALGTPASRTPAAALTRAVLFRAVRFPVRTRRLRHMLARLSAHQVVALAPVAAPARSGGFPIPMVHPPSRPTVLRI